MKRLVSMNFLKEHPIEKLDFFGIQSIKGQRPGILIEISFIG